MIDFTKIKAKKREHLPTDPYDIFRRNVSRMSDSGVNDLWAGQVDALREWHDNRAKSDISLVLNTGAGKTLIGALIAQSLLNETKGKVVYACGSIQLIEQTREKFESYGLHVTTYFQGDYSNDLFEKNQAVCLTTYQALFNGKSKFFAEDLDAIIFDDAHTAEGMIKNHFSLDISRSDHFELYETLCGLFNSYYKSVGRQATFNEILAGQNATVEHIPPFEILRHAAEIRRIFEGADVNRDKDLLFGWEHVKNHLDLCAFFISTGSIQIIPPFVPIRTLPYFQKGVRRVYLTATSLGIDAFIRTFGQEPDLTIKPETPAGQCERQILFPLKSKNVFDDRMSSKEIIKNVKALVIVPSKNGAKEWMDVGFVPKQEEFTERLIAFKKSKGLEKLVLAARYDGIDLPGDTCRVLVLDGLPKGTTHLDKFQWETLKLSGTLRSLIACRVIQSLGRISRGMSDYGVVIVSGSEYVKWLNTPKNQSCLPEFIQKQLKLGCEVSESAFGTDDLRGALNNCLERDESWLDAYDQFMDECEVSFDDSGDELLTKLAKAEVKFSQSYWDRDYIKAAKIFADILNEAFEFSAGLGSWYAEWQGYCSELAGDAEAALSLYRRAHSATKGMPKISTALENNLSADDLDQTIEIANEFEIFGGSNVRAPKYLVNHLKALYSPASTNEVEEALRYLGQYLGLDSTRPDKEHDIGPDVLWISSGVALCIEAKTDKESGSGYRKDDVGQMANHIQWVRETYPQLTEIVPVFIGPINAATESASPTDDICVTTLTEFYKLGEVVKTMYEDIEKQSMPISINSVINTLLKERSLIWPKLIGDLSFKQLKSL